MKFFVKGKQKHSRRAFQSRLALLHPQDSALRSACTAGNGQTRSKG